MKSELQTYLEIGRARAIKYGYMKAGYRYRSQKYRELACLNEGLTEIAESITHEDLSPAVVNRLRQLMEDINEGLEDLEEAIESQRATDVNNFAYMEDVDCVMKRITLAYNEATKWILSARHKVKL